MNLEEFFNKFSASTDSKCSCKLEQNSRGTNVTLHVYAGVTKKEIEDTIKQALEGISYANRHLPNA